MFVRNALWIALLASLAVPAEAALFLVNNQTVDQGDLIPGDGKCEWSTIVPASERCTLRAAVQEANNVPGEDVILIPDGWRIILNQLGTAEDLANTGDLDILESVSVGSLAAPTLWPILDGNNSDRVFEVHSPAQLTISALQIRAGNTDLGAGIAVRSGAAAVLTDCRIEQNVALAASALDRWWNCGHRAPQSRLRRFVPRQPASGHSRWA